jgi:hypothetical protein
VREFVEGTMINIFYDMRIEEWKMSTQHNNSIIHNGMSDTIEKSFKQVFNVDATSKLNDIAMLQYLPTNYSYTFVLKQQNNSVYKKGAVDEVYLIAVYKIDETSAEYVSPTEYENWPIFDNVNSIIKLPRYYDNYQSYNEIIDDITLGLSEEKATGFIIQNINTGEQCKQLTIDYTQYHRLLHIAPIVRYKYICVNRINQVTEYLSHFPSLKNDFYKMKSIMNQFINTVYYAYTCKYRTKTNVHIDKKYLKLIHTIHHEKYLPRLKTTHNIVINRNIIKEFINKMEPRDILHVLHS